MSETKSDVRSQVWAELRKVAIPDSRFHYNFAEFIADFQDSSKALDLLTEHEFYQESSCVFITPDNCLEELRYRALNDGKTILMTTYGIFRGFYLLEPGKIPAAKREYASTLDGMEKWGTPISLKEIKARNLQIDYMITGTGAINYSGVRFGKGHGYFDLEWGMLFTIGAIDEHTHTAAVVHDVQLLDQSLKPEVFDTVCDIVATNTQLVQISEQEQQKPTCGILWDKLAPGMFEQIPPLRELKLMQDQA